MTVVLGVDLSLAATGLALPDGTTETLGTPRRGIERISYIVQAIAQRADGVDLLVIEGPFVARMDATTQEILMLHGALRLRLHHQRVPLAVIAPATLKKYAAGHGQAKKPDMRMALYRRTGIDLADDNQVDAWWLRAAGMQHCGVPVVELPQLQVAALDKAIWPELAVHA